MCNIVGTFKQEAVLQPLPFLKQTEAKRIRFKRSPVARGALAAVYSRRTTSASCIVGAAPCEGSMCTASAFFLSIGGAHEGAGR
jgi:hypothetical protein